MHCGIEWRFYLIVEFPLYWVQCDWAATAPGRKFINLVVDLYWLTVRKWIIITLYSSDWKFLSLENIFPYCQLNLAHLISVIVMLVIAELKYAFKVI